MSDQWLTDVVGSDGTVLVKADQLVATAGAIAEWQLPSGMIPWFPGGHADAWNHTLALMALMSTGHRAEAERGFEWLQSLQRPDGAWHQYYLDGSVEQDKLDANCVAFVATGAYHYFLLTQDLPALEELWPMVERAIDFVLDLQLPRGEIRWARHADGTPWTFALLTGSSSICHSLRCAIAIAEVLGHERPDWELSAARLARVIREEPAAFAPKRRWAMDWYYPVLTGALTGDDARARLSKRLDAFRWDGWGIRCVSDRPWVTAAETCECATAHAAAGEWDTAFELFGWAQNMRADSDRYWTGIVLPDRNHFPANEQSTYTSAAVVVAADALSGASPASFLFIDHDRLPELIDTHTGADADVTPTAGANQSAEAELPDHG